MQNENDDLEIKWRKADGYPSERQGSYPLRVEDSFAVVEVRTLISLRPDMSTSGTKEIPDSGPKYLRTDDWNTNDDRMICFLSRNLRSDVRISIVMVDPPPFARRKLICADKNTPYVRISLIIITRSLWFSSRLRCLAYVPSAYVSDISRLSVRVYVGQQQRYSTPLEYYLTFQGSLDSVLSSVHPLSLSLLGDTFEFRGTYEVKKINLATKKSTSVPLGEEHVEDDWSWHIY